MSTGFKILSSREKRYYIIIGSLIAAIVAASFTYFKPLNDIDYMISDFFYQSMVEKSQSSPQENTNIKIISIDEATVNELGNYAYWSRSILAELITMLNGGDSRPDVIGIDLDLLEEKDSAGDNALVETCSQYHNICIASTAETTEKIEPKNDKALGDVSPVQSTKPAPETNATQDADLNQQTDTDAKPHMDLAQSTDTNQGTDTVQSTLDTTKHTPPPKPSGENFANSGKDPQEPDGLNAANSGKASENMLMGKEILSISFPFDALLEQVSTGIINTSKNAADGFVRSTVTSVNYGGTEYDSFAVAVQRLHVTNKNQEYHAPAVDDENTFGINFAKGIPNFDEYSFLDVIKGNVDMSVFKNCIVLIGDYTTGTTYNIPGQLHEQMPEIRLQANTIHALLENNILQYASKWILAIWYSLFSIIFFTITSYSGKLRSIFESLLFIALQIALCCLLNSLGYYVPLLQLILLIIAIVIINLIISYILTRQHRNALETTLRKYVDDQVVDGIVKDGVIDASIGVVRKDIAVLFVDIRGFTSLSESLPPEYIVDILNHYLTIISHAISRNDGTLDKFIGDAAMAVFNSPFDIEDYVYKAVCTAWDIRSNAAWLNELCQEKYGRQVAFGIGIHCGDAVVGNIGCESRMDYTAIGDTVNTSSRLEGSAGKGQILISEEVKNRLGDRINTKFVGDFSLKGKQNTVPAYEVTGIRDYVSVIEEAQDAKRLSMLPALSELLEPALNGLLETVQVSIEDEHT